VDKNLGINEKKNSEKYVSDKERRQLLLALHSRLFWVGQHIPDYVEFEGESYPLHSYVWELVQKDELSLAEKSRIDKCIEVISAKEKKDEKELEERSLTSEEARKLYHETAGLLRAIIDLKEIESGAFKENTKRFQSNLLMRGLKTQNSGLSFLKKFLSEEPKLRIQGQR
jgi:phosphoribosyl-ATP pyrophosphohydrolase